MWTQKSLISSTFCLCFVVSTWVNAPCQTNTAAAKLPLAHAADPAAFEGPQPPEGHDSRDPAALPGPGNEQQQGWLIRGLRRGLEDQKEIYVAPFRRANLKWDALVLAGTAAFIATDRQTSRALPTGHDRLYSDSTNIGLGLMAGTVGGVWAYGIKKDDQHAMETGELELETLVNTFLVYTPMQFIAGRERPEEGTGNGRFLRHHGLNTSFPSGHAMFGWAMATVVAHEYPKTWVKVLAYTAATSASAGRFLGRKHFPSDVFVGSVLGYAIATHIFHVRCNPERSESCPR